MQKSSLFEEIGESVDRLVTVDFSGRGVIRHFYDALRQKLKRPTTLLAAERLVEAVKPNDFVFVTGGMLINPWRELGETDGPLGAAILARALQVGLGAKPVVLTEKAQLDIMKAACRAAGLNLLPVDRVKETRLSAAVIDFPIDENDAREASKRLLELNPKALLSVEKRGPNEKGVYHSDIGYDMSPLEAKVGFLFDEAIQRRVLTIGIGDGGNEIGLGMIKDAIREVVPTAVKCICPCGAGIVPKTQTDIAIVSSVSNWGAYGIAACLSAILNKPEVLHDKDIEMRMLRASTDEGAIDGNLYVPILGVDGLPGEISAYVVEQLREIVKGGLQGPLLARKDYDMAKS